MRKLGLDYGDKTIGVAVSDGFGWTAQGVEVIKRSNPTEYKKSIARIATLIKEYEIDTIILGYPKNMDNTEGERCEKTKLFQAQLETAFPTIPVILWDERMSTIAAERSLLEADISRKKRKNIIDKMAAVYILQGYLDKKQNKKYIDSVFYDIQKEKEYKNIIIFVEDISKIDLNQFCFGLKEVLIIESSLNNLDKLGYISKVNWSQIIQSLYQDKVFISEYNFCDYTDRKRKFVSCFYFIDTEKINLLKYFLKENKDKKVDIICSRECLVLLEKEMPNQNYYPIEFDSFIKGEFNIYE